MPDDVIVDPRLSFDDDDQAQLLDVDRHDLANFTALTSYPVMFTRNNRPMLHLWSTQRPSSYDAFPIAYLSPPARHYTRDTDPFSRAAPSATMTRLTTAKEAGDGDDDSISEVTKLKGVLWPGMDLFDAATPDRRKKRNQKKETSVIDRLERNALIVEANEMMFTPRGSLYKERPITGQVDFNSSPYKMDNFSSPPAKRKPAARAPLARKDANRKLTFVSDTSVRTPSLAGSLKLATANNKPLPTKPANKPPEKRKAKIAVYRDEEDEKEVEEHAPMTIRLLTTSLSRDSQPVAQSDTTSHHSLDYPYSSMYRPAYQHRYLSDAFDTFSEQVYGASTTYPIYGHTAGQDIPGFFSVPSQFHGLSALEHLDDAGDMEELPTSTSSDARRFLEDDD